MTMTIMTTYCDPLPCTDSVDLSCGYSIRQAVCTCLTYSFWHVYAIRAVCTALNFVKIGVVCALCRGKFVYLHANNLITHESENRPLIQ